MDIKHRENILFPEDHGKTGEYAKFLIRCATIYHSKVLERKKNKKKTNWSNIHGHQVCPIWLSHTFGFSGPSVFVQSGPKCDCRDFLDQSVNLALPSWQIMMASFCPASTACLSRLFIVSPRLSSALYLSWSEKNVIAVAA